MRNTTVIDEDLGVSAQVAEFEVVNGVSECHMIIRSISVNASIEDSLESINKGLKGIIKDNFKGYEPVFKRYFLSDAACQSEYIKRADSCAVSVVQQPSLDGCKVVLWVWLMKSADLNVDGRVVKAGGLKYLFDTCNTSGAANSKEQTIEILENYNERLNSDNLSVEENCMRTWLFVRDVDVNYAGVVAARNEKFDEWGLTNTTHYIASTGINGLTESATNLVSMDAYAVEGLEPKHVQYLYAYEHLSPTHVYGVAFERGTALHLSDRTQVLISGTASIDGKGSILYPGDIVKQTNRMLENVDALLSECGATEADIAHLIVYLRDIADYKTVQSIFSERFPHTPTIITWAPVCRQGWLIEVECMALKLA